MIKHYVEIPGSATHELPPLLVRGAMDSGPREAIVELAGAIVESEDIIPDALPSESLREQRKLDLAIHLADQYYGLLKHWNWGDSILEWIRQCEITFESQSSLRHLLHNQIWPHADTRSRCRESCRLATDFPPAAAHRLLLEPVSVSSEFDGGGKRL
jgi:hypothetical protein